MAIANYQEVELEEADLSVGYNHDELLLIVHGKALFTVDSAVQRD